ncbi:MULTISPECIES: hypothetical protein [unclassified Okeania]|nr:MULTISPECIES: hypothetical protein [unclassified Okeania]
MKRPLVSRSAIAKRNGILSCQRNGVLWQNSIDKIDDFSYRKIQV